MENETYQEHVNVFCVFFMIISGFVLLVVSASDSSYLKAFSIGFGLVFMLVGVLIMAIKDIYYKEEDELYY